MSYTEGPIRNWVAEERPREKMMSKGISALTEAELLATLLASGTRTLSAVQLGRLLIDKFGGLANISRANVTDLMAIDGIGAAKATCIVAAFELARRKLSADHQFVHFQQAVQIARYLTPKIGDLRHEVFYVLFLDRQHNLIYEYEAFRGGISSVIVDARMIFKEALNRLASGIVLAHNHPSGSVTPSRADDDLTYQFVSIGRVMDISLVDHVVIARSNWYSYGDTGRLHEMRKMAGEPWSPSGQKSGNDR